jgi:O-antigen ligase
VEAPLRPVPERLGAFLPALIALALPTVWIPTAVDSFILPRASIVIAAACIGLGLAVLLPDKPGIGALRWPLVAAAAAALLAFAFSVSWPVSFAGSYTRYESLPIRLSYLGLLAIPAWLVRDQRPRDWVIAAFVLGTAVACGEAIIQQLLGVPFRPDGNTGNAGLLGALVAMAVPLAVSRAFRGGWVMILWLAAVPVLVAGLVLAASRSGALGALAGLLTLMVLRFHGRQAVIAAVTSIATMFVALLAVLLSPLRFLNGDPGPTRLHLWPDALHMIAARPLTGWGEDTTGLVFGRFLSGDWSPGVTFDRAHAGLLDLGATQGLLGIAALGWLLLNLGRHGWRHRFVESVGPLLAASIAFTVWVSINFDWAPVTGAFWLLAGTAWSAVRTAQLREGGAEVRTSGGPALPVPRSVAAIGLALAAACLAALPVLADVWYYQGRSDLAVLVDPIQARYHRTLGEALVSEGNGRDGVVQLRLAANLGETDPALYVELGDEEMRLGDPKAARNDYRKALEIDPYFGPALQRLATNGGLATD